MQANTMSVISTTTGNVVKTIKVGEIPDACYDACHRLGRPMAASLRCPS
jgi:hypothetical protein